MIKRLLIALGVCFANFLTAQNIVYTFDDSNLQNELTISTNPLFGASSLFVVALETTGVDGGDHIDFTFSSDYQFNAITTPDNWSYTESTEGDETQLNWKYDGASSADGSETYDFESGWNLQFEFLALDEEVMSIAFVDLEVNSFLRVIGVANFAFNDIENFDAVAVPEPTHAALLLVSFLGAIACKRWSLLK